MYFLDTNTVIHFNKRNRPHLERRMIKAIDTGVAMFISPIVRLELEVGVIRSSRPVAARKVLDIFISLISGIPPFESQDAELAARIRADLMWQGQAIGAFDLLIAAQAVRMGAAIVTNNSREFSRVPGLKREDWTLP